jgi:hypothetical protein
VSVRPQQPEPFIRGCLFTGFSDATYPRANPADLEHLSPDVWQSAQVPVGVRLEFVGDIDGVRINYETTTANLGYRGEGAGCRFAAYRSGQKIAEVEAVLGEGVVELPVSGEPNRPVVVYLPEGMRPIVHGIEGIGGFIEPAPRQPRWLCYGDAITQGWLASSPSLAWPAVTARKLGLDLCNFGYAGSARVDTTAALAIADMPTDLVSISLGANNWSRFPHTPALCAEELKAMISLVRSRHHNAPMVIVTPFLRPEAEDTHNRLGATLTDLRFAMGEAVRERIAAGDVRLYLVDGATVIRAADLSDGMYPGDDGHIRIAAAVGKMISPLMNELRNSAETRWAAEAAAALRLKMPQGAQMAQASQPSATGYLQAAAPEVIARMNALAGSNGAANGAAPVSPSPAAYSAPYQPQAPQVPAQQVAASHVDVAQQAAAQQAAAQQAAAQQAAAEQVALHQAAAQQAAAQQAVAQQAAAQQAATEQVAHSSSNTSAGPAPARGYENSTDQSSAAAAQAAAQAQAQAQEAPRATPALPPSPAVAAALPPQAQGIPQMPVTPRPVVEEPAVQSTEFEVVESEELALDAAVFEAATDADFVAEFGELTQYEGELAIDETELSWETPEYEPVATPPEPEAVVAEASLPTIPSSPSEWVEASRAEKAVDEMRDFEEIDWSGEAIAAEESFWSEMIDGSPGSDLNDLASSIFEPEGPPFEATPEFAETPPIAESPPIAENPAVAETPIAEDNRQNLESRLAQDLPAEGSAPYPLLQAARYLERQTDGYPELGQRSIRTGEPDGEDTEGAGVGASTEATEAPEGSEGSEGSEVIGGPQAREAVSQMSQWQ